MTMSCYWSRGRPEPEVSPLPERSDVVVIGGGLAGLSVAWWLSQRSIRTTVLDRLRDPGAGSVSAAGTGLVEVGTPDLYPRTAAIIGVRAADDLIEISGENARLVKEFSATAGTGYRLTGCFNLTTDETELTQLTTTAEILSRKRGPGREWSVLGEGEANARAGTTGFIGGVFRGSDAVVQPVAFLDALEAGIVSSGSRVIRGVMVEGIRDRAQGVEVMTSSGSTAAEMVVLSGGAGSVGLHGMLKGQIVPVLGQALAWSRSPAVEIPVSANFGHVRFRTVACQDGSTDMVAWHTPWSLGKSDPEGLRHGVQEEIQQKIESYVAQRVAGLKGSVSHRWGAHAGYTVDNLPLVGPMPGRPRLVCCCGFSGHDWSLAFAAGARVAAAIDSEPLEPRYSPMSPRRFIDA